MTNQRIDILEEEILKLDHAVPVLHLDQMALTSIQVFRELVCIIANE